MSVAREERAADIAGNCIHCPWPSVISDVLMNVSERINRIDKRKWELKQNDGGDHKLCLHFWFLVMMELMIVIRCGC